MFVEAWNGEVQVLLNPEQIQRIGVTKSEKLKQSDREAKIVFADGSTGIYVMHRNVVKQLLTSNTCSCEKE